MENHNNILNEQIQRIRELANYDKSKTLSEQTSQIVEELPYIEPKTTPTAQATKTTPAGQTDIKSKKFPCFSETSFPYNYKPSRGDTVGHYASAKMDFLRMFFPGSIIVAWENGTIKQYVRLQNNASGVETKKGTWKCKANNSGVDVVMTDSKTTPAAQTDVAKKQTPSQPVAVTDQNLIKSLTFEYTYPGDNSYIYAKSNGKWYGKNNKNNKIFDISKNYPAVAKNLDSKAVVKKAESDEVPQPPQLPTTPPPITSNDNAIQPPQEK